jgi:hypothetical protein
MAPDDKGDAVVVTTVRLTRESWRLARALAEQRAQLQGGQPSVSAVLNELLAKEAKAAKVTRRGR